MKHLKLFEAFMVTNMNSEWLKFHKGKLCLHKDFGYLYIIDLLEPGYWEYEKYYKNNKSYRIWGELLDFFNKSFKHAGPHHFGVDDVVILTPQELFDKYPDIAIEIYEVLNSNYKLINKDVDIKYRFLDIFKDVDIDTLVDMYKQTKKYNI